jgi:hypothetical protein
MQQADFNHEDFSNQQEADKSLMVRFFYKNVENKMASKTQGRPIFKEKTYIEIRVAGQRDVQACRPATMMDKRRFPAHFEAFEKRMEPPTEGMPLVEWPKITRTQAEELSFKNVKTVEQLASMKDSNLQQFMNGYKLREQAIKWLDVNSEETDEREKAELKQQVADLQAQMAELIAANKDVPAPEKQDLPLVSAETAERIINSPVAESLLTKDETPPVEGAAVKVAAAPGATKARRSRKKKT